MYGASLGVRRLRGVGSRYGGRLESRERWVREGADGIGAPRGVFQQRVAPAGACWTPRQLAGEYVIMAGRFPAPSLRYLSGRYNEQRLGAVIRRGSPGTATLSGEAP